MKFTYCDSVCSDLIQVKKFIEEILIELSKVITDKNTLFDIRLILTELIVNGVFHGNKGDTNKCVNINISILGDKLKIKVTDEGSGIDYDLDSYNPRDLKGSGRGLVIVSALSEQLIVQNNSIIAIMNII